MGGKARDSHVLLAMRSCTLLTGTARITLIADERSAFLPPDDIRNE